MVAAIALFLKSEGSMSIRGESEEADGVSWDALLKEDVATLDLFARLLDHI